MNVDQRATKKQKELLSFVDNFIKGNGFGPSYREIMRALDYKSVSTVAVHIDGLIASGYLAKRNRSARSLEVLKTTTTDSSTEKNMTLQDIKSKIKTTEDQEDRGILVESLRILGFDDEYEKQRSNKDVDDLQR